MPTRPGFDVIPLRKETKARLTDLKGGRTYDEVLQDLLEAAAAGAEPAPPRVASKPRHPDEQVLLARLAARRWRQRLENGRLVELGPRLFEYRAGARQGGNLNVRWDGRRGFAP